MATLVQRNHARNFLKKPDTASAETGLRELIWSKADVEYGVTLIPGAKAEALVRRARALVELAVRIVRLHG